jgi:hypothetical protein
VLDHVRYQVAASVARGVPKHDTPALLAFAHPLYEGAGGYSPVDNPNMPIRSYLFSHNSPKST